MDDNFNKMQFSSKCRKRLLRLLILVRFLHFFLIVHMQIHGHVSRCRGSSFSSVFPVGRPPLTAGAPRPPIGDLWLQPGEVEHRHRNSLRRTPDGWTCPFNNSEAFQDRLQVMAHPSIERRFLVPWNPVTGFGASGGPEKGGSEDPPCLEPRDGWVILVI